MKTEVADQAINQRVIGGWRTPEGFGRPVHCGDNVYSVAGPDDEQHAVGCFFITERGIIPCNCDATRQRSSWWWQCWYRWMEVRVQPSNKNYRVKWPIPGPDKEPWVPGVDYNDEPDKPGTNIPPRQGRHRAEV